LNQNPFYAVVTTIQAPTEAMRTLARFVREQGGRLVMVGDKKGPLAYPVSGVELITLEEQLKMPADLARLLPVGHYARKNLGYLLAISRQAPCIYETDDDNAPMAHWKTRTLSVGAIPVDGSGWRNVYRHFSSEHVWPRGFPLEELAASRAWEPRPDAATTTINSPIQQGLADGNPDVDAVWRLILTRDIRFESKASLVLRRGAWCPFNSQNTWWWPEAYPLLYLPSYCTFRMTDIWRSFVAQRCLWEINGGLAFHAPDVMQERNEHNLLRDFQDEVPGYLNNSRICAVLERLELEPGSPAVSVNLRRCYETLVREKVFPDKELELVDTWLADLKKVFDLKDFAGTR
jgi:hypothetical protein